MPRLDAIDVHSYAILLIPTLVSDMAPPRDHVEAVLADIIREHLENRESATVPGLGTFQVTHRNSSMERKDTGEIVMRPPRDEIVFNPEA